MNNTSSTLLAEGSIEEARELAKRYAGEVRTHFGKRLRGIRLYGSAARGDWMPGSDIDILIRLDCVSGRDSDWIVNRAVAMGLLGSGLLLQPLFLEEADFQKLRSRERRLAIEIEREGTDL